MAISTGREILTNLQDTLTPETEVDGREELKKAGFSDESIATLGDDLISRFEAAFPIYQRGVEGNLALREVLSSQNIDSSIDLSGALEAFIIKNPVEDSPSLIDTAIISGSEALQQGIENTLEGAESWGKSQVEEKLGGLAKIPLIGEWLSGFVFNTVKDTYENNKTGLFASVLGYLGFGKILEGYGDLRDKIIPETVGGEEIIIENDEAEVGGDENEGNSEDAPETQKESPEILAKRAGARDAGYRIMIQISGIDYGEKNSTAGIYEELSNKNIAELRGSLGGNIPQVRRYKEDDIKLSLIGLSGPIVKSLLHDRVSEREIHKLLGFNNGGFNELAHIYFSQEELNIIAEKSGNYEHLPIGIISRLLSLSYRETIAGISQMVSETRDQVGVAFTNALFSQVVYENLETLFEADSVENDIYPDGMARVLSNNLNVADRKATRKEIIGADSISELDSRHLDNFITFRDSMFIYIQNNFGLGIEGFQSELDTSVGNGDMIGLYLALRGRSITEISESDKVIIYAWVYNVLPSAAQGAYTAKMMREIAEGYSEGEENHVMTAVLFRISQYDREVTLNSVERTISGADQAVMDQVQDILPEAFAGNSRLLRIATWAVEIGGFTLLMKILFKMPVMRAVLIATSGIAGASIYFGLKEGIYNSLNNDVKKIYDTYIDLLIENGALGGEQTKESLISGINDNSIGYMQVVGWLNSTNFSEIASEALS